MAYLGVTAGALQGSMRRGHRKEALVGANMIGCKYINSVSRIFISRKLGSRAT